MRGPVRFTILKDNSDGCMEVDERKQKNEEEMSSRPLQWPRRERMVPEAMETKRVVSRCALGRCKKTW